MSQLLSGNVSVLIVVFAVLGVPVAIVLVVVVVTVLAGLVTAGSRVDVRMLVLMHAMLRVAHHRNYLLHRPSRRPPGGAQRVPYRVQSAQFLLF